MLSSLNKVCVFWPNGWWRGKFASDGRQELARLLIAVGSHLIATFTVNCQVWLCSICVAIHSHSCFVAWYFLFANHGASLWWCHSATLPPPKKNRIEKLFHIDAFSLFFPPSYYYFIFLVAALWISQQVCCLISPPCVIRLGSLSHQWSVSAVALTHHLLKKAKHIESSESDWSVPPPTPPPLPTGSQIYHSVVCILVQFLMLRLMGRTVTAILSSFSFQMVRHPHGGGSSLFVFVFFQTQAVHSQNSWPLLLNVEKFKTLLQMSCPRLQICRRATTPEINATVAKYNSAVSDSAWFMSCICATRMLWSLGDQICVSRK